MEIRNNCLIRAHDKDIVNGILKEVILPEGLEIIEEYAFKDCQNIQKVIIPSTVNKICKGAFAECKNLIEIDLPEGLEKIESETFNECISLTKIIIPSTVKEIGSKAFRLCISLKEIVLPEGIQVIHELLFSGCQRLEKIMVPSSVKIIEYCAFSCCKALKEIQLPKGVILIGDSAFASCSNLPKIVMPTNLRRLGQSAFESCTSLKEIIFQEGLETIEGDTFRNCFKLEKVSIPNSLKIIKKNAFFNCLELKEIVLSNNLKVIENCAFYRCNIEKLQIPSSVTEIHEGAFNSCRHLKKITLPDNLKAIERLTFSCCDSLETITLPKNLEIIKFESFIYCTSLKKINLPQGLRRIGNHAFTGCKNLTEITIPSSVKIIDTNVFQKCFSLQKVYFESSLLRVDFKEFKNQMNLIIYNHQVDDNFDYEQIKLIRQEELLDKIYKKLISNNHIYNLKREDLDYYFNNNQNFNSIIQNIIKKIKNPRYSDYDYNYDIEKFNKLFPNTRFSNLPNNEIFENLDINLATNYKTKIVKELQNIKIFNITEETRRNVVDVICVFGLFENDKYAYARLNILKKLLQVDLYLTEDNFEMLDNYKNYFEVIKKEEYIVKENIVIPEEFKKYLNTYMYDYDIKLIKDLDKRLGKLINDFFRENYMKKEVIYYHPIKNIELDILEKIYNKILSSNINNQITITALNRIFNNSSKEYNEEALNFIIKYFKFILSNESYQSKVREIIINYRKIKNFYIEKGNKNFTFQDAYGYLKNIRFENIHEGNYEFALLVKNAGVTNQETFEEYQELYEKVCFRRKSNIPRVLDEQIIKINNKQYKIRIEILRKDDPFGMLVGESKYTNCCQKYNDIGEECMLHSVTDGRVFCTYLIDEEENKQLLSQSWVWRCGNMICFDNVEGTNVMNSKSTYKDIVAYSYKLVSKQIIEKSRELHDNIKVISIGEGYDDLGLENYFGEFSSNAVRPNNYNGYVDSHRIYFVIGNSLLQNEKAEEKEIYLDERKIIKQKGCTITYETINKIKNIEKSNKEIMDKYINIESIGELCERLNSNLENTNIILGEDWYYIYEKKDDKIYIHDLDKTKCMYEEENIIQTNEMIQALYEIMQESIIDNNDIKEVEANLKEDQSYILFLKQVRDGNLILLDDYIYDYNSKIEETEIQNNIAIHRVRFKINNKIINNNKQLTLTI